MDRGHVDQEATRQSDVAGDPRSLLAERLLGDLDDDILAGLEHLGDELRTTRRTRMASLIAPIMSGPSGTAFETASAAIGTATAAVRASATAVVATVTSTAAERALEARTRIAADTRGVAREIF